MDYFDEVALRLKQSLKVTQDQDVAEILGLSKHAWMGRKKRNSFPEKELWALVAKRPDLNIDVGYVLNGIKGSEAAEIKNYQQIIDRFLTVYKLNTTEADEKLSLPPGTIAQALSNAGEADVSK